MPPARSKARKRALDILFEAEVRGEPVLELLEQRIIEASPPVSEYAQELVRGVQGDRSTGGTKPATLQTGATVQVPLFISTGEKIKVDTRTGQYLGRA